MKRSTRVRTHRRKGKLVRAHKRHVKAPKYHWKNNTQVTAGNKTYKVKTVGKDVLHDYDGMNYYAGRDMGFEPLPAPNVVLINKYDPPKYRERVAVHEAVEANLMKKGMKYWPAHKRALKAEEEV